MTKLSYFGHIIGIWGSLGKTTMLGKIEGSRKKGRKYEMGHSIKEAIGLRLQEQSKALEDVTLWTSLLHRAVRTHSCLNGT